MIRCAMDTGGGSLISPLATLARSSSREPHRGHGPVQPEVPKHSLVEADEHERRA
jgi:hypothetical protein